MTDRWEASRLADLSRSDLEHMQLRERVFAELTAPSLVTILSGTSSIGEAQDVILEAVKEIVLNTQAESEIVGQRYWDDIVDVGGGVVRRWDGYGDDYHDEAPLLSEYQTSELQVDWADFGKLLVPALTNPAPLRREVASVLRLDVVDLALYQALCRHPELLKSLNWRAFEELLADILQTFGFEVELQRGTKDGGVDIFAIQRNHPL